MRHALLALLMAVPTWSVADIAPSLLEELDAPPLDADGCALNEEDIHKKYDEAGDLVECGQYVDGHREGFWLIVGDKKLRWQGWFRNDQENGTWLATSSSGRLRSVARYDGNGEFHGVSYQLESDGRLLRHHVYAHGNKLNTCGKWTVQC